MRVRCGRCRMELEVSGPGRFSCPTCGTVNEVREAAEGPMWAPRASPGPSSSPSPKVTCPDCGFQFIVGEIETAICPNCSAEVPVSADSDREAAS